MPATDASLTDAHAHAGTDFVDHNTGNLQDEIALKSEDARLQTFIHWPTSIPVQPEQLARDGFYYLGSGDRVKCVFCNLILKNWEAGDIVRTEHAKFNPNCAFLLNKNVGNIPKLSLPVQEVWANPKFPQYSQPEVRLETLARMPRNMSQCPKQLAQAGFFYTGDGDNMQCFQCGGNLRNWEPHDDPWVEHQLWFPNCPHLLKDPAKKDSLKMTPVIEKCIEMGYDQELIKTAISKNSRLKERGVADVNELITAVEELKVPRDLMRQLSVCSNPGAAAGSSGVQSTETSGASSLEEEYFRLKEQRLCKICMEREIEATFVPCGHYVTCLTCAKKVGDCPICRQKIRTFVHTYLS